MQDLSTVSDLRSDSGSLVWAEADMSDLRSEDEATIIEEFDLDPMAVEDAMRARQRPKFEAYENHRFAVLHELYESSGQLEKKQVSCFVGDDYLLIIHEGADELLKVVRERLSHSNYDELGPVYLLYALLDTIVDEYQEHADRLEDIVEEIEDAVVTEAPETVGRIDSSRVRRRETERVQRRAYSIKQQVARLRRYAVPLERELHGMLATENKVLTTSTSRLFRDVHDHTLRIGDQIHQVDSLTQAVLDLIRGEQGEDLNQVQKKLTGWAAIVAVPTVIAGIYGMNYRLYPSPDHGGFGFWFAIGLMALAVAVLYLYFRNKEWL